MLKARHLWTAVPSSSRYFGLYVIDIKYISYFLPVPFIWRSYFSCRCAHNRELYTSSHPPILNIIYSSFRCHLMMHYFQSA